LGAEAEFLEGAGGVEHAAGLAVGFGGVPDDAALKAGQFHDERHEVADGDFETGADIDGIGFVVFLCRKHNRFGRVLDVEKLACGGAGPPDHDFLYASLLRVHALFDQGGDDMGGAGIEVVAGTIEIDGQEEDRIEPVLLAVRLGLDKHHLLGQAVRGVGFLGVAAPEVVFFEGNRGELGVGADRPESDEFLNVAQVSLMHQLDAHHDILIEEGPRMLLVEADAADFGRQMDDDVGPLLVIEAADVPGSGQVVVAVIGNEDIMAAPRFKGPDQVFAEKATAARDGNALCFHGSISLWPFGYSGIILRQAQDERTSTGSG